MRLLFSLCAALCLTAPAARGMELGGMELPKTRGEFRLQGAGLLRKGLVFKIYVGALYVVEEAHAEQIMDAVPKRIDIHYFHNTPKKHMVNAAQKALEQNLSREELKRFAPSITALHAAYIDGRKGSVASLVFKPGEGLTYLFDGRPIITLKDDAFANAYFTVWLGDRPSSRTVKEGMLGGVKP